MGIIWTDAAVQAAVIQALGGVLATVIAAITASIVGKKFTDQKRLQEKVAAMQSDIRFLLAVEDEHCNRHGNKIRVRDAVRGRGLAWTGKFTPSRFNT